MNLKRVTCLLLGATALIGTALAAPSAAMAAPSLHRGFNTFPWMYRAKTIGNDPQHFDYAQAFPYLNTFTASDFAALHQAGADFVRVPLEPSPLIAADPAQRAALIQTILAATQRVTQLGMTAILDLHPRESVKGWGAADILHSPALLAGYRDALLDLARAMAATGDPRLVLELMNEPQGGWSGNEGVYWIKLQPDIVRAVRQVAPHLPLVVTGDRGGGIDGLIHVDPTSFDDPAIFYSFHYYLPMIVTHQGADWGAKKTLKYMHDVPYPAPSANEAQVVDAFRERAAQGNDPEPVKMEAARDGTAALENYFRRDAGAGMIEGDFARVVAWARHYHIPGNRIVAGEFGTFRPGASEATAANWAHAVRTAAEAQGFAWSYFNYAPFDENGKGFSVLAMQGPNPTAFDAAIMQTGLGLKVP